MQPLQRHGRRIQRELRPDPPVVYERLSDPVLITRAKHGDKRALEVLCARHVPRVERLARHLLSNPEDAQDAAQESLAKLCQRIEQFRGESQFTTWLHRLVVNTCRDIAQRQKARQHELLLDDVQAAPERPDVVGLRDELRGALAEIPPAQRHVVVLKDALDLSFEEVAAAAAIPVGTAKCYAHRARERLPELSLIAGRAVADAIAAETGLVPALKHPNDVLLAGRKVAGVLAEASEGRVVLGIGVNVSQSQDELPPGVVATSLRLAGAGVVDRAELLATVLERLEVRYDAWVSDADR